MTVDVQPSTDSSMYSGYFLGLNVSGIKCFLKPQEISFSVGSLPARWTLLLGDNGTGKTTILQMLACLRPDPVGFDIDHGKEPYLFGAGFPLFRWRLWLRKGVDGLEGGDLTLRVGFAPDLSTPPTHSDTIGEFYLPEASGAPNQTELPKNLSSLRYCQCMVVGYGAYRRLRQGQLQSVPLNHNVHIVSLFDSEAPLVPAEEWFLQRDYAASKLAVGSTDHTRAVRSLDRVTRLLLSILPDVISLEAVIPDPSVGGAQLIATTPYGKVRVSDLGLGYQATLAWVTDLAARMTSAYPESDNPLAEPAVVLVDEIDLHLHPRWQRTLLESLSKQFPNVQWIVTAHSPLIVQNAPEDSQIVVLRREGDQVLIENDPTRVRDWRLDQILTSDLFGLPTARPKRLDALIEERDGLLGKAALTSSDEARLRELSHELDGLPVGEVPVEIEAMRVILDSARQMKGKP